MNELGNFKNIFGGSNYRIDEPLNFSNDKELDELAKSIAHQNSNDPFWDNTVEGLLKALLYYVCIEYSGSEATLSKCLEILKKANINELNTKDNYLSTIFSTLKFDSPARMYYKSIEILPGKSYVNVVNLLIQKLEKLV